MNGKIFDIQRFSIYDGPGIRTNVFFKGCNLKCLWCHNPESQSAKNQLMFFRDKCVGCGKCAEICNKTFTDDCIACGRCVEVCRHKAREISGKTVSADEVVKTVLRDAEYYMTSGGGVTLSGGEPLLQPDFAAEILRKCKENGIHTAIETAANVPAESINKCLPYIDFILCDIKCADDEKHKTLTGVSNKRILENAELFKKSGKDIVFRMPVIPGLNNDQIGKISELVKGYRFELLAYHSTGCGKYDSLGMKCKTVDIDPPSKEFMTEAAEKYGAVYNPTGI